MITYKKADTSNELKQILSLQQQNLPNSISQKEKETEGFLTVEHDFNILNQLNEVCPHIIAKEGKKLAGYVLCMHPKFADSIDVLKPMFKVLDNLKTPINSYIVMGQVCVDKAYRKSGVFRRLYDKMLETTSSDFDAIVTEVDATNNRSLEAHLAIGFKQLTTHEADGKKWQLIYLGEL